MNRLQVEWNTVGKIVGVRSLANGISLDFEYVRILLEVLLVAALMCGSEKVAWREGKI